MVIHNPESRPLTLAEMTDNAEYILGYLLSKGWTRNAICGILGNMQSESSINPARWEGDNIGVGPGFGLVQWTPASKYIDWANARNLPYKEMDSNLERILYEVENNLQWFGGYSDEMNFQQFTQSTQTPEYLAHVFISTYEHPADPNQPIRETQARYWWDNLSGTGTIDPGDPGTGNDICFIFPTTTHNITSPYNDPTRESHYGVDFADGTPYPIVASAAGTVVQSYVSSSYGEVVILHHTILGKEYETLYAHMVTGSRKVAVGDTVTQGHELGTMGSTGDSTGLHLHFEMHTPNWVQGGANSFDPMTLLGKGGCGTPVDPTPPKLELNHQMISLLLSDTLNGWKW